MQCKLSVEQVERLLPASPNDKAAFTALSDFLTSGPCMCVAVGATSAVLALQEACGPAHPATARKKAPSSLRALFGTDLVRNAIYASETAELARQQIDLVFDEFFVGEQNAFALLTPDLTREFEFVMNKIAKAGFIVSASVTVTLPEAEASKLLSVMGVAKVTPQLLKFVASGAVTALRLTRDNAVRSFLQLCGPEDTDKARCALLRCRVIRVITVIRVIRVIN
jgi:nucleoside-diphosphate kinase